MMNSFWAQKQQINCTCFNIIPKNERKIFRSQSYHSSILQIKKDKQHKDKKDKEKQYSIKCQSQQKYKKKSLKKQKNTIQTPSEKNIKEKQKQQHNKNILNQIIPTPLLYNHNQKIQKTILFDHIENNNNNQNHQIDKLNHIHIKSERIKTHSGYRLARGTSHIVLEPLIFESQKVNQLSKNKSNLYFQQIISKQLVKQIKQPKDQHNKINHSKQIYANLDQIITKPQQYYRQTPSNGSNYNINNAHFHHQNFNNLEKFQKFKLQNIQKNKQYPQKTLSFRNSSIHIRQKQIIFCKRASKMQAREIQSEDDGNSISSESISEVVGRGWDGLTEQRIEIQELEKLNKRQVYNAETMVTQESNIQASQTKTFTDYSNSFISPKSQKTNMMSFGGFHKYGVAGMSYQNIQDLGRNKGSYSKLN